MHISARTDYALRALAVIAADGGGRLITGEELATSQGLPRKFLDNILSDLRRAGILASQRGAVGGYRLARPAAEITVADVMRSIDGPLAEVRGLRPEDTVYDGAAAHLSDVWIATRQALRRVLEAVTIADIAAGTLPAHVQDLLADPRARLSR